MSPEPESSPGRRAQFGGVLVVLAAMWAYYSLYFLPPRSMGERDPDRYFHLGLSRLMEGGGWLDRLPQAEDIGWGRYFPDKEFLFHQLTGWMEWIAGDGGVLFLVPLLGIAILLVLQVELGRRIKVVHAVTLVVLASLLTPAFMFRLTLLRPHLLAILFFVLTIIAIVRARPRLAGLAALGFVLSYHAFYVIALVAATAWVFRRKQDFRHAWAWVTAGLVVGVVVNPYFPSNVEMGLLHLKLALGAGGVPGSDEGVELRAFSGVKLVLAYGFIPASLILVAVRIRMSGVAMRSLPGRLWFTILLTAGFWLLGTRSPRAMEYAMPCCLLMLGYAIEALPWRHWIACCVGILVVLQGYVAQVHYRWYWQEHPSHFAEYAAVVAQIPADAKGKKVFNCEWWAGSFILHQRPDLRFVVLLEPAFLWEADRDKYVAMEGLNRAAFKDPRLVLRGMFEADYVLCASKPLIGQMQARRMDFVALPGTEGDRVRLFAVRPD